MTNLPQNRNAEWMPSSEARNSHREWIAGRAVTLLSHYWRDDDPEEMHAAIGQDWADVLEGLPKEFIQKAAIKFQQQFPNKRPTPAMIYSLTRELMPSPVQISPVRPTYQPALTEHVSAEEKSRRANEILERAGFRPKTMKVGSDDE